MLELVERAHPVALRDHVKHARTHRSDLDCERPKLANQAVGVVCFEHRAPIFKLVREEGTRGVKVAAAAKHRVQIPSNGGFVVHVFVDVPARKTSQLSGIT